MSFLIKRGREYWQRKPNGPIIINESHWASDRLTAAFPLTENGGEFVDLVNGVVLSAQNGAVLGENVSGDVIANAGGAAYFKTASYKPYEPSSYITLLLGITKTGTAQAYGKILNYGQGTAAPWGAYVIEQISTSPDSVRAYAAINGTRVLTSTNAATDIIVDVRIQLALRYDGAKLELFKNGIVLQSINATGPMSGNYNGVNGLSVGARDDAGQYYSADYDYLWMFHDGILDNDEIQSLYDAPYQFIKERKTYSVLTTVSINNGIGVLQSSSASMSGTGTLEVLGSGALQSNPSIVSGVGIRGVVGFGLLSAASSGLTGTGSREVIAVGNLNPNSSTLSGSGIREVTAIGILTALDSLLLGSGAREVIAAGNLQPVNAILQGSGSREVTAIGTLSSLNSLLSGIGNNFSTKNGIGNLQSAVSILQGSGSINGATEGVGTLESGVAALLGLGVISIVGAGALNVQNADLVGVGSHIITGNGDLLAAIANLSGVGANGIVGHGSFVTGIASMYGVGVRGANGQGDLIVGFASIVGNGSIDIQGLGTLVSGVAVLFGLGNTLVFPAIIFDTITVLEIVDIIVINELDFVDVIQGL